MTPPNSFAASAKPPPAAGQEQQYLLTHAMDACALALNGFSLLRSTLAALQAKSIPGSHQYVLTRLSIEVLDDYAARLRQLSSTAQDERQGVASLPFQTSVGGGARANATAAASVRGLKRSI